MLSDMFDAFVRVITSLAAEESWASVPALLPPAHLALYTDVNATHSDLGPAEELLHEPLYRSAAATPDAPAVLTATAELTYAQLAALASSVAASLTLGASSRVGILLPKGWQQVVAAMGILSAGMVFIPLDVYWPEERLRLVASLASLAAIVSISAHRPRWYTGSVVLIDALKQQHAAPAPARTRVSSDSEAYIIFTSGSTGQPKGVAISHRGALNTVRDVNKRFAIKATDRVFGLSELHFDLSIWCANLRSICQISLPNANCTGTYSVRLLRALAWSFRPLRPSATRPCGSPWRSVTASPCGTRCRAWRSSSPRNKTPPQCRTTSASS